MAWLLQLFFPQSLTRDRCEWNPHFPGLRPDLCSCAVCTGFACNAWVTFTVEKHCGEMLLQLFILHWMICKAQHGYRKDTFKVLIRDFSMKKIFSCLRTIKGNNHGSGLPREVVQSASLEVSNSRLGRALGNLVWFYIWPCFKQELEWRSSRNPFPPELPYDPAKKL